MLDRQTTTDTDALRIMGDPNFQALVRERRSFGWTMSAAMLVVYLGFIFLAAFGNDFMSSSFAGTSVSWGILLGLGVIIFAFVLTGLYVARANGRYDDLTARLERDVA